MCLLFDDLMTRVFVATRKGNNVKKYSEKQKSFKKLTVDFVTGEAGADCDPVAARLFPAFVVGSK